MRQTPLGQLVEVKLDQDLSDYVLAMRADGKDWRTIAAAITEATGVSVSHETVRAWFADEADTKSGAA